MVDYKKAALTGAVVGTALSFFMGPKTRRSLDYKKIATYAAGGAGAVMAVGFAMAETGRPIKMLATAGEFTGHGHHHDHQDYWNQQPIGHQHFGRY
jgi:hypothetical protein